MSDSKTGNRHPCRSKRTEWILGYRFTSKWDQNHIVVYQCADCGDMSYGRIPDGFLAVDQGEPI